MTVSAPPFVRFLIVGATAVGLNLVLYTLLVGVFRIPYLIATAAIFFVGNAFGFVANRSWTFSLNDRPVRRLILYYATMLASLGANLLSMLVLVDGVGVHYLVASAITSIWLAPVLYLVHRRLAFKAASAADEVDAMLVTNYFPEHGGGVEAVAGELSRRLARRWDIRWFAAGQVGPADHGHVTRITIESWNGIERRTGLPIPVPTPLGLRRLVSGVRSARVVWIHDVHYFATIVAAVAALMSGKPLLVTAHVGRIPYRSRVARLVQDSVLAIAGASILTRAHAVVFVSDRIRQEFESRFRPLNARLIVNGVDESVFRPFPEAERLAARARLGVGNRRMCLFVGRFVERKGLHLLHELARATPSIEWVFAGDGPLNPDTWSLPNVHVLRRCDRTAIARLYGAADLLVLPSVGEGFPLVIQEAMATGIRVLVDPSTVAGFRGAERFMSCESVTEPGSAQRWREHVVRLLETEDADDTRVERIAFARDNWNWDDAADSYSELINGCLQPSQTASSPAPARS